MQIRKLIIGVIIMAELVTTAALTACGTTEDRKRSAEKLLAEKYKEDFVVTSYDGQQMMESYYTVTAYAKNHPGLPFEANIDDNTGNLSDDYVSRRVCASISERITLNLSGLPCTYYVHTDIMSGDSLCPDPDISVEQFVKDWEPGNRYYVYLYLPEDPADASAVYDCISRCFSGLEMLKGNISIYRCNDQVLSSVQDYVESNTGIYSDYAELTNPYLCGQFGFENGVIAISQTDVIHFYTE